MEWVLFVVLSASFAIALSYLQKLYANSYTALETSLLSTLYALPLVLLSAFVLVSDFSLTSTGVAASIFSGVVNVIGLLVYQRALGIGDLSIVAPFTSVTPLLTALIEPALTATVTNPVVLISSAVVVIGAAISLSGGSISVDSLRRKDVWMAMLASLFYAVAAIANDRATATIDPIIVVLIIYAIMVAGFIALLWVRSSPLLDEPLTDPIHIGFGATYALLSLTLFVGYSTAPSAAHVTTVRKLSVIGTVVIGVYAFGEQHLLRRVIGSALITVGVLLISLS